MVEPNTKHQKDLPEKLLRQLRGYKMVEPPTKHHKDLPDKLVFHIHRKQNYRLKISLGQLTAGEFFLGMRSCEYSTNPKGETK